MLHGLWDLSSQTRDGAQVPAWKHGLLTLNHQESSTFYIFYYYKVFDITERYIKYICILYICMV